MDRIFIGGKQVYNKKSEDGETRSSLLVFGIAV